jgi:hypothetical protein
VELKKLEPAHLTFMDENGNPLTLGHRLAEKLREHLEAVGVDRCELRNREQTRGTCERMTYGARS